MTQFYRCLKCSTKEPFEFWAEQPVCPQCGLRRDDARLGQFLIPLHVIHFDPPEIPALMKGKNVRACEPAVAIQTPLDTRNNPTRHGGTGDPRAVTCPQCKETEAFKAALLPPNQPVVYKDKPVCCGLGPEEFPKSEA